MNKLYIPIPSSLGLLLSYKCNIGCRDCIYACSPKWNSNWISKKNAKIILSQLSDIFNKIYPSKSDSIGFNYGLHFTGGEPFLNFNLLVKLAKMAKELNIPSVFVETNCFWAKNNEVTRDKLTRLKKAGLDGILISVNPFNIEYIPFHRIEFAVKIGREIFGANVIIYQEFYLNIFKRLKLKNTLPFKEFLEKISLEDLYRYIELLPIGRAPYKLGHLYRKYPAGYFFDEACKEELTRSWHTHIDNYCNYIPGFCAGISLGNSKDLNSIFSGIDLGEKPILKALSIKMENLYKIALDFGYKKNDKGYISKCHLCTDIRKYIVTKTDEFTELNPKEYYLNLE